MVSAFGILGHGSGVTEQMCTKKDLKCRRKLVGVSSTIKELLGKKRRALSETWSHVQMVNRERIQLFQIKCRRTTMLKVPRKHSKTESDQEEQVTSDRTTSNRFANMHQAVDLSEAPPVC